jgi:hypothetical protein
VQISGGEIAFLIISMVILGVIFMTKSKAHAGDSRIRSRRDREREREREQNRERRG